MRSLPDLRLYANPPYSLRKCSPLICFDPRGNLSEDTLEISSCALPASTESKLASDFLALALNSIVTSDSSRSANNERRSRRSTAPFR